VIVVDVWVMTLTIHRWESGCMTDQAVRDADAQGGRVDGDIESLFLSFCLADEDRVTDQLAAQVLDHSDFAGFLEARKDLPDARPHIFRLGRRDVLRHAIPDRDWTGRAVRWIVDLNASWEESAEFCGKLGRRARDQRNAARPYLSVDRIFAGDHTTVAGRAWLHLYLSSLRYEFRTAALEHAIESMPVPVTRLDPYVHALYAFALLAQNKPEAKREVDAVLGRAGDDSSVLHALIDGLRFAERLPNHLELMLDLLHRPVFSERTDVTMLFREAFVLRRLGRYDEALAAIDRSLALLSPNDVERYQQRMAERYRIVDERHLARMLEQETRRIKDEARNEMEETSQRVLEHLHAEVAAVRQQISEGTFKIVEILGIFTAIIALAGASLASVATAGLTWWQRAVLIGVGGVVTIGFFLTLRYVVHSGSRPKRQSR
jgi:tetratricopeptide (TPR) repeat protein